MFWKAQPRMAMKHDEKKTYFIHYNSFYLVTIYFYTHIKNVYILSKSRCFIITFLKYIDVKLWKIDQIN